MPNVYPGGWRDAKYRAAIFAQQHDIVASRLDLLVSPPFNTVAGTTDYPDDTRNRSLPQYMVAATGLANFWQNPLGTVLFVEPAVALPPGVQSYPAETRNRQIGQRLVAEFAQDAVYQPAIVQILATPPPPDGQIEYPDATWYQQREALARDIASRAHAQVWQNPQFLSTPPPPDGKQSYPAALTEWHRAADAARSVRSETWQNANPLYELPQGQQELPDDTRDRGAAQRGIAGRSQSEVTGVTPWLLTSPEFNTTPGTQEYPDDTFNRASGQSQVAIRAVSETWQNLQGTLYVEPEAIPPGQQLLAPAPRPLGHPQPEQSPVPILLAPQPPGATLIPPISVAPVRQQPDQPLNLNTTTLGVAALPPGVQSYMLLPAAAPYATALRQWEQSGWLVNASGTETQPPGMQRLERLLLLVQRQQPQSPINLLPSLLAVPPPAEEIAPAAVEFPVPWYPIPFQRLVRLRPRPMLGRLVMRGTPAVEAALTGSMRARLVMIAAPSATGMTGLMAGRVRMAMHPDAYPLYRARLEQRQQDDNDLLTWLQRGS